MGKLIGITAGIFLLFYVAIIYENTGLIFLGLMVGVLTIFALATLMYQTRKIRGHLRIPIVLGEVGKEVSLHLELENDSKVGCHRAKVKILRREHGNRKKPRCWKKWISLEEIASGKMEQMIQTRVDNPGVYEFELGKLRIYDWFGIFFWDKKLRQSKKLIVFPEIHQVSLVLGAGILNFFGDAETYDELRPGYDPSEIFDIREFRAGDKIQSVHWKLSARTEELMIRESSLPKACPVVLFLELEALEWAMSVSFSLCERKCPHFVAWHSGSNGDIVRTRVEDEESFYNAFYSLLMDDRVAARDFDRLKMDYDEKYRGEHYVNVLYFKEKDLLLIDDEKHVLGSFEETELFLGT